MNVFIIPSWYPADSDPLLGIFFKEQALFLAQQYPEMRVGVSVWGQGEEKLFLSRKGWRSTPGKVLQSQVLREERKQLFPNLVEYHSPVLQWTNKILSGNIRGLLRVNRNNFVRFREEWGSVSLIHAHVSYPAGFLAMKLSQEIGVPYVITEHMGPFPFPSLLNRAGNLKAYLSKPLQNASKKIAVSKALAKQMSSFGISGTEVIPNVVDEDFFAPSNFKKENSLLVNFFTLSFLSPEKGIGDLIQAISLVVQENTKVHFRIGGDGPARERFQGMANDLGLSSFISWLGVLDRKQALAEFHRADAFVLPSRWESFGLVCAEALACGVPVIATKCGGPLDILTPLNGFLVEEGDVIGLAGACLAFAKREQTFDPKHIREDFMGRFSKRAVLPQLLQVYDHVVKSGIKPLDPFLPSFQRGKDSQTQ